MSAGTADGEQQQDGWIRPARPGVGIELTQASTAEGTPVLRVRGEIDEPDAHALHEHAQALLTPGGRLVADLAGVRFLGTFGINALVRLAQTAQRRGARFSVATGPGNRYVRRPIFIAGLAELLQLTDTVDA